MSEKRTVGLTKDLLYRMVDILNSCEDAQSQKILDELTAVAELQGVPIWFDENRNPLWRTRTSAEQEDEDIREIMAKARAEGASRTEEAFLQAWKDAIRVGARFMGARILPFFGPESLETATGKNDLAPKWDKFKKAMSVFSMGEKMYLGALYSFYSMEDGQELLSTYCGHGANIAAILSRMDGEAREAICELARTYPGW